MESLGEVAEVRSRRELLFKQKLRRSLFLERSAARPGEAVRIVELVRGMDPNSVSPCSWKIHSWQSPLKKVG